MPAVTALVRLEELRPDEFEPAVTIPNSWAGVQLRPTLPVLLVLSAEPLPDDAAVLPLPADWTQNVTRTQARRLAEWLDLTTEQRTWARGKQIGRVLLALMDVKPTRRNGRRLLRLSAAGHTRERWEEE